MAGALEVYVTVLLVRPVTEPVTVTVPPTRTAMVGPGEIEIVGTGGGVVFSSHAAKARVVANKAKILNPDVRALIWSPPGKGMR
jgi:hypothetical protein